MDNHIDPSMQPVGNPEPASPSQGGPQQQAPAVPVVPVAGSSRARNAIIAALGILLVAGVAAAGYYAYQQQENPKPAGDNQIVDNGSNNNPPPQYNNTYPTSTPSANAVVDPLGLRDCSNTGPVPSGKTGDMEWVKPRYLEGFQIFASSTPEDYYFADSSYLVGHFAAGKYQGGDLLITIVDVSDMMGRSWHWIVKQGSKYTVLGKYSDPLPQLNYPVKPTVDAGYEMPGIAPTANITAPSGANLALATTSGFYKNGRQLFCADHKVKLFTDAAAGDVYGDASINPVGEGPKTYFPKHGFYVRNPDGTQTDYMLSVPFIGQDNVPLVTWSSGAKNTAEYNYQAIGGCGVGNFADVADVKEADLKAVGTTFSGDQVFEYKDKNAQDLQDFYNSSYFPDNNKPSYASFVAGHPIFFWKDQFGRFIRFKDKKFQPMAECGKPVIYLYPEKTEQVTVKLNPLGGFTYTEPVYNGGWTVIAKPNGELTNVPDGKQYPYLFWEGRGGMYETPEKGFVIKQADVHSFLVEKLAKLGLNGKESADFIEFWEPRMQGSPYYFVTFMGNSVMDSLAPLSVTPKPDTVIRVLMDFKPLQQPISVQGYSIRTPERKGFTVVEWGGVLSSDQIK